jgi:hypothetical protein
MSNLVLATLCALTWSARAGLVQSDGTIRSADSTLCATNENGMIRMRTCDLSNPRQIYDMAHFDSTGQVKNTLDHTCWWVPSAGDPNNKNYNQKVWLIRCDTSSSRLDTNQLQWYMEGSNIRNAYTDAGISDYCLMFRGNGYPLKMKPCSHNKVFAALV